MVIFDRNRCYVEGEPQMRLFNRNRCYNGGKKHKFKERTDIKTREYETHVDSDFKEILQVRIYIHDVCVWCGKSIERKQYESK